MGFYWSYTLLLYSRVLTRSCLIDMVVYDVLCVLLGPPVVLHAAHLLVLRLPCAGHAALCSAILVPGCCHRRSATST